MSIMIPSTLSPEVKSSAEKKIFEWFKEASGTDNWIVMHSLGITTHNKVIFGEIDFLVFAPKLGVFALEVKGGRVRRENGIWYFTDRYDKSTHKSRGPFDQAKEGIFSIISAMEPRLDISHKHLKYILYGYGVMFPDIEYSASGIDEEQWQVFDLRDNTDVLSFIQRLSNGVKSRWESIYGTMNNDKLPDCNDIRYLASIFRGDFDYAVSLGVQLQKADKALISLTEEQYRCLDQLEDNPRCLIHGPAGTGKTLLALEAAKKAVADGERVALICFNTNLADWFNGYFSEMPVSVRPAYIGSFHKYMVHMTKKAELFPPFPGDAMRIQEYYQEMLPQATLSALEKLSDTFDRIILDEAQDLIQNDYLCVLDRSLKKGLERGKWSMFGDFSMQAIYAAHSSGPELMEQLENWSSFVRFKLTINCRNTKPICKEIETVTGFKAPKESWTKVDGPPVQYITWTSMKDQAEKLKNLLSDLVDSHINPEQITILSPVKREDSVLAITENVTIKDFRVSDEMCTMFSTIQAYKGLENTVIIITDINSFSSEKLMYVGLSRARSGLYILESENANTEYNNLLIRRLLQ